MSWLSAGAGLVAAVLVAACGGGGQGRVAFSQVEVQAFLEREVARTLPDLDVGAASCPVELPAEVGATATCTVEVERVTLSYEVQRLAGDRFEARPQPPIVTVRDIAVAVRSELGTADAGVRCADGAAVLQPVPGQPLGCEITGNGPPRTVTVEVGADGAIAVS